MNGYSAMAPSAGMLRLMFAVAAWLACIALAHAQAAGVVTHLSGTLSAKKPDGSTKLLAVKSEVKEGDLLATEDETYARIKFADGGEVVMRPNSQLKIDNYAFNHAQPESDNVGLSMLKGGLRAVTGLIGKRNRDKVNFSTQTATIGIRGTHFGALFCNNDCGGIPTTTGQPPSNGLHLDVADGAIVVRNGAGQQQINAGQFGYVANAQTSPQVVPPQQGIQVTMPQSISQNKGGGQGIGKSKEGECSL